MEIKREKLAQHLNELRNVEQGEVILELKYEGIDDWNRPVFKSISGERFGSVDELFNYEEREEKVLEVLATSKWGIVYFGRSFGCEPMGTSINAKFKLSFVEELKENKVFTHTITGVCFHSFEELVGYYGSKEAINWKVVAKVIINYDGDVVGEWR